MPKQNLAVEQNCDIGQYIRKAESDFTSSTTKFSKYVDYSVYEDISKIYAYLESKHISSDTDSMGRDKPFFNIVLAARNIWFRATDIDRSNIKIRSTKSKDDIAVFLATVHLQEWMRRENFGTFLNSWGINSAGFNESVLKFVEQKGKLIPSVIPWSRMICDVIDFDGNPKIEILELTMAQLRARKSYDQAMVDSLEYALTSRQLTDKQNQDNKPNFVRVYEVHGMFPKSYITELEADENIYLQQMHVVSFLATDDSTKDEPKFDDFTLFAGFESQDPYMLGALLPEIDGSIALRGSVKTLFDAQWMQNHSMKAIKDNLDLASKMIFQTADGTFVGQNVLSSIENGDILIHKTNEPLTQIASDKSTTVNSIEAFAKTWKQLGNEITGISEAMLGINPPSGSAWRQTQALLQENHSLFELMTENKGLVIEKMMRKYILPYLKKQMNNSKEIAATLAAHDIQQLDERFIKTFSTLKANTASKELLLSGKDVSPQQHQDLQNHFAGQAQQMLQNQGNIRYFKPSDISNMTWRELFKDIEWEPEVDVTNENVDKDAMATLNTLFEKIGTNPNILQNPNAKFIFNKILEMTGTVSPIELANLPPIPRMPTLRMTETIAYKDAPPDVQRQMEAQAGLTPSQMTPPQQPPQAPPTIPAAPGPVGGGAPMGR